MYLDYNNVNNVHDLTYNQEEINKVLSEGDYTMFFENINMSAKKIDVRAS